MDNNTVVTQTQLAITYFLKPPPLKPPPTQVLNIRRKFIKHRTAIWDSKRTGRRKQRPVWGGRTREAPIATCALEGSPLKFGRGDDMAGNPHRAQISQFKLFELFLLVLKLDKQFPVEQFGASRAIRGISISVSSTLLLRHHLKAS